jgi:hypothetical protein
MRRFLAICVMSVLTGAWCAAHAAAVSRPGTPFADLTLSPPPVRAAAALCGERAGAGGMRGSPLGAEARGGAMPGAGPCDVKLALLLNGPRRAMDSKPVSTVQAKPGGGQQEGQPVAIVETAEFAMLVAGLGLMGFVARRRHADELN